MESDTVALLEDLPADLTARGWTFVPQESKTIRKRVHLDHIAIYLRPYHAPIDHLGTALTVRGGYIYVSTGQAGIASWAEAREAAIERMRAIDAPRTLRDDRAG